MMKKINNEHLVHFRSEFNRINQEAGKKQFLTYYLIAAHPGCTFKDMLKLRDFTRKELKIEPEQVQIFTPLPSTYSALMYYTEMNPFTGEKIFVEKDLINKQKQKDLIVPDSSRKRT